LYNFPPSRKERKEKQKQITDIFQRKSIKYYCNFVSLKELMKKLQNKP